MNLIDRYVHEVGRRLPRKKRADIETELQSTLNDTLDSRIEGEPSEEDVVQLLKDFGPPTEVAASYHGDGQYLIGPDIYPFFRMVTGIVLVVMTVVQVALQGVLMVFTPGYFPNLTWIFEFAGSLVGAFGIIVLVFVILQYFGVKPETEDEEWDPRSLPDTIDEDPISASGLVLEMTFGLILVAILLFLPDILGFIASAGGGPLVINPVLQEYLGIVIVSLLLGIGLDVVLLWRGEWTTVTRLLKIGVNLFGLAVLYLLIDGHTAWLAQQGAAGIFSVLEKIPASGDFTFENIQLLVMWAFRLAFVVAFIVIVIETMGLIYNLIKNLFFPSNAPFPATNGG